MKQKSKKVRRAVLNYGYLVHGLMAHATVQEPNMNLGEYWQYDEELKGRRIRLVAEVIGEMK